MKFVVEQAGRAGERAGQLELAARTFATPLPLLHSRGGAIPHLTQETLLYLENSGTVCRHLKYSVGSALILLSWIRIRSGNADPDLRASKLTKLNK